MDVLGRGVTRHLICHPEQCAIWNVGVMSGIPYLIFLAGDGPQGTEALQKEAY